MYVHTSKSVRRMPITENCLWRKASVFEYRGHAVTEGIVVRRTAEFRAAVHSVGDRRRSVVQQRRCRAHRQ